MKHKVIYQGGQSRFGVEAVDYMMVEIDGVELYAEAEPMSDEIGTYEDLKADIIQQAKEKGIKPEDLIFWFD